jgi:rSAM/selenodomain-associated transferase 1
MVRPRKSAPSRAATLGIFAKWPYAGAVKTRLASATSPSWAARVADAFLRDVLARMSGIAARRVIAFAPDDAEALFAELAGAAYQLWPQPDGDLGCRMEAFLHARFSSRSEPVVLIGTDSPNLPVSYIERAFDALDRADVVLGPCSDGGYYLLGCAHGVPAVFRDIEWGTSRVLLDTITRLRRTQQRLVLLPAWYDVDTIDDWRLLRGHLAAMRRAGLDPETPHTEAVGDSP